MSIHKFIGILAVAGIATGGSGCGMKVIDEGHVGVFRYNPYLFGKSYLDTNVIVGPNRTYTWLSTSVWEVKFAPTTFTVHARDFQTKDKVPLEFDIAITIKLVDPKSAPPMILTFGDYPERIFRTLVLQTGEVGNVKNVSTGEFMSFLRDQVRRYESSVFMAAQNTDGSESDGALKVEKATIAHINEFLAKNDAGVIKVVNIALGVANPPPPVMVSIVETANQEVRVKTEASRYRAEMARKQAEAARADADKTYTAAMGITSEQFVQLEQIKMQRETCSKGNCTFIQGQSPVAVMAITK